MNIHDPHAIYSTSFLRIKQVSESFPVPTITLFVLTVSFITFFVFQWAFGVLLWELTTLAQQPYAEIDPFEMAASLQDGYRLNQPVNCPDEL